MNLTGKTILLALAIAAASQAQATEWWHIPANPDARTTAFVDADAIKRVGNSVTVNVLHIDRAGRLNPSAYRFVCNAPSISAENKPVRDFACGNVQERMSTALMLGSLTPVQASQAIFSRTE